jgi:ABC-type transport system substrate-binding protein
MRIRTLAACLTAGVLLLACGGTSGSGQSNTGPKQGGTLTTAIGIDPDTLDPAAQTTTTVGQIVLMMVEPLATVDQNGKLQPVLATKWEMAPDAMSYTFTLRQGVKFSDGEPFNAQAVKFNLDRLLSPTTFKSQPGVLKVIKDTQVVDDSHVKVGLKNPFAPFVSAMAQATVGMIAPNSVNQAPNTPATIAQPVGTGPYVFKERVKGDHITMTRNPSYWGQKPAYATQTYKIVPEAASRESLVKAGQVDVAHLPPANDIPALKQNSDVKLVLGPSDRTIQIVINNQDKNQPLLSKPEVRQALNYAVNKQAIVKNVLFGAADPVNSTMTSSLVGYCKTGTYDYNPSKAKQLLQQAGASGMSIKLISPQGRYISDYNVAQAIAGDLRNVGLKVDLGNPMDWPTYISTTQVAPDKATTDLHLLGWAPQYLDASQNLIQFQKDQWPPAGQATGYFENAQADALIQKANGESNDAQRKQDYCQAQQMIWNSAPWIFLYNQKNPFVVSNKVQGVIGLPNEQFKTTWATPASNA